MRLFGLILTEAGLHASPSHHFWADVHTVPKCSQVWGFGKWRNEYFINDLTLTYRCAQWAGGFSRWAHRSECSSWQSCDSGCVLHWRNWPSGYLVYGRTACRHMDYWLDRPSRHRRGPTDGAEARGKWIPHLYGRASWLHQYLHSGDDEVWTGEILDYFHSESVWWVADWALDLGAVLLLQDLDLLNRKLVYLSALLTQSHAFYLLVILFISLHAHKLDLATVRSSVVTTLMQQPW